jgi:hypothetical protein
MSGLIGASVVTRRIFIVLLALPALLGFAVLISASANYCAEPFSLSQEAQQDSRDLTVPHGKKLVMKDGSFQIVSSYQLDGDRVRYFSVERAEWEEIPASLVDWAATKQAEASQAKADAALTNKLKADEQRAATQAVDVDASVELSPGVFLPPGQGFFIVDGTAVSPLRQSSASAKLNKGHLVEQIAVPVPVVPSRTSVDLPGRHAAFRTKSSSPEFYLRTAETDEPEVELIVARVQGNKRHIENIDTLFGQQELKGKTISLQEWRVANGLYRFTLGQPLAPGEYALAQFSPKEGFNLLLWDFGVDASKAAKKKLK